MSFSTTKTRLLFCSLVLLLAACAFRGELVRVPEGLAAATSRPIFFATSRQVDTQLFGTQRSRKVTYGVAEVSIPPNHKPGQIEWPRGKPDPQKHFLLSRTLTYPDGAGMRATLDKVLSKRKVEDRDVVIFIHGFNNQFGDGIYRIAQMGYDLGVPGIAVTYSWPSAGNPLNYAYDRDSALFARDGLRQLIEEISKSKAREVILVAHSLGSLVTMETLRELHVSGKKHTLDRIGGVVLMSPDVDLDVFRSQADAIGKLPDPFIIFSSRKDRALRLVERLTGQKNRLGRLSDVSEIAKYNITYIDVTAYGEGGSNHFVTATSPALLKILSRVPDLEAALSGDGGRTGILPGTILSVQNATNLILAPATAR